MFDLKRPLEGAAGLLLLIALLCLGALFGMSFAILTRGITGETLPQLWGSALGAGIGATATLLAAMYNQRLTAQREKQKALNEVLIPMLECTFALMDTNNQSGRMLRWSEGDSDRREAIQGHFDVAARSCSAIRPALGLAEKTNEHVRGGRMHLDYIFEGLGKAVGKAMNTNAQADWREVQEGCTEAIIALDELEKSLKATL